MRFYPVLATVVAIATPLSSLMAAQAQTPSTVLPTEKSENITDETISSPPGELDSEIGENAQNQTENQPQTSLPIKTQEQTVAVKPQSISQENQQPAVTSTVDKIPASGNVNKLARLKAALSQSKVQQGAKLTGENSPQPVANYPITTVVPNTTTKTAAQLILAKGKSLAQAFPPETPTAPAPLPDLPTPPNQEPGTETPQQIPNNTPVPQQQPQFPNTPTNNQPGTPNSESEPQVLVAEVLVRPETGQLNTELENEVYRVIRTQPGRTTTRSQLQQDINAIFATGFFANVQAVPEDTPVGVRVSFVVQPNPVLSKVEIQANPGTNVPSVLPAGTVDEIFKAQYGRILNLRDLQEGIKQLNKRYQDQGYVLANVVGSPQVTENGVVTLQVAEGVVEDVRVRFRNKEGQDTDDQGRPIRGRTKEYIVTREVELKSGQVFNRNKVQRDLQRVFNLGLFEDINISLDPGQDPSKVDVVVNVVERNSGSIAAGAGISSASGLFGTISYQEQNFGGRNQKLGTELQVGQRELLFDVRFTDPWIAGDPYRTSYTANLFRRRSISLIFDGKDQDIRTFDIGNPDNEGDRPRVLRLGGGINFTRPLSRNPFERSEWVASAGLQYQRVSIRDADGDIRPFGRVRNDSDNSTTPTPTEDIPLSFSKGGEDDLLFLQLGASRDRRNNALQPTTGSFLRFGVDQSVPVGLGNIFLTRLRGSYSHYFPVQFIKTKGPQTLAFNFQGGTILGDLPPYEAFTLGGSNSVRGYEEGGLGSGRSFVQATAEYRFPLFSVISGALFFDVGSDLGTTTKAASVLNKDGLGYGYGLGVRIQSPLGPIRIDYGINDDGDNRINFGIGERF